MCIWQILYFDRIAVSEGIDVNKTSGSKASDIFHYWYFLNYSFKFQPNVYNRCHDLLMLSMNLSNIAILKPLHIMLAKTNEYTKIYDGQTNWMYFLIRKI